MVCIDVSIIIVNWNTKELLRACLRSVFEETRGVAFEVIVVDNASSDGSAEMTRSEFASAILVENAHNRGFAAANNQGLAVAEGRYALLLNSDTVVLDGAVQKTIAFADLHLDAAVVGCLVRNPDRSLQNTCFMFPSVLNFLLFATYVYRLFPRSRIFGREQMTWWKRDDARQVDVVTGCFMLVRKEAIEQVGSMDEAFFMYAEETDWCYRFKRFGWTCWFTPSAEIVHLGGGSAPKLSARRARITNASFVLYMSKHWSKPRAFAGRLMIALFYIVRLTVMAPRRLFGVSEHDAAQFENHWAGLKDILAIGLRRS
jgi:GT2 family glycosyltransferase